MGAGSISLWRARFSFFLQSPLWRPLATIRRRAVGVRYLPQPQPRRRWLLLEAAPSLSTEDFDCTGVGEVRVRFSTPGFVDRLHVGLYVNYADVPAEQKLLRIWWDLEGAYERTQDVRINEADVDRVNGRLVFEKVIEHHYRGVVSPTRFLVRTELITVGKTGNCARNREIVVSPGGPDEIDGSLPCDEAECTVFVTSTRHDGDLGGLEGADDICQELSRVAGLSGSFKAWLSDDSDSPSSRFTHAETPYVLTDGARIASNWGELTTAVTRHIDVDERQKPDCWVRHRVDAHPFRWHRRSLCARTRLRWVDQWRQRIRDERPARGQPLVLVLFRRELL